MQPCQNGAPAVQTILPPFENGFQGIALDRAENPGSTGKSGPPSSLTRGLWVSRDSTQPPPAFKKDPGPGPAASLPARSPKSFYPVRGRPSPLAGLLKFVEKHKISGEGT